MRTPASVGPASHRSKDALFLSGVFVVSLVLLIAGLLVMGSFVSVDTVKFLTAGESYIEGALQWRALDKTISEAELPPLYFVSSVLLTVVHQYWGFGVWGVLVFNCVLFALIVCAVFVIWRSLCGSSVFTLKDPIAWLGLIGGFYLIFGLPDGFLWSYWVMTEVVFLFWVTLFIMFTVRGFILGGLLSWNLALAFAVTAVFVRPPGVLIPILYCFAATIYATAFSRRYFLAVFMIGASVPLMLVFGAIPLLVLASVEGSVWPEYIVPDVMASYFGQAVYYFNNGIVVSGRVELSDVSPLSYSDIVYSIIVRLTHYWLPLRFGEHGYSVIHNIVNGVYVGVVVPLGVLGVKRLIYAKSSHRAVLLFLFMVAYTYAMFHAVTLVSYEWRYQLPGMVPLWSIAGFGWWRLLDRLGCKVGKREQ